MIERLVYSNNRLLPGKHLVTFSCTQGLKEVHTGNWQHLLQQPAPRGKPRCSPSALHGQKNHSDGQKGMATAARWPPE